MTHELVAELLDADRSACIDDAAEAEPASCPLLTAEQLAAVDDTADLLDGFLLAQRILQNATKYRARRGAFKPFKTPADALLYETGWDAQKEGLALPAGPGPESQGWLDAEREDVDAREVRDDERRERAERS